MVVTFHGYGHNPPGTRKMSKVTTIFLKSKALCPAMVRGTPHPGCDIHHSPRRLTASGNLENGFHFRRHAARQRRHPDRGAGMLAGIAEDLDDDVRCAVDHLWVIAEIGH